MLHGLWIFLKVVIIILLIIIGLLLLIALSVLFVPVRYRGRLSYSGEPQGVFKASWLLHILSFRLQYEKELTVKLRIFGFLAVRKTLLDQEETDELEEEMPERVANAVSDMLHRGSDVAEAAGKHGGEMPTQPEPVFNQEEEKKPKQESKPEGQPAKGPDKQRRSKRETEPEVRHGKGGIKQIKNTAADGGQNESFFRRMRDKLTGLLEKKERFLKFWNDGANKRTFSLVLKQCKRLLHHIRPRKARGRIAFGFADPYTTGQVLQYVSPFLGWYHRWLNLEPYFDREVLKGNLAFQGRIRIMTVLLIGYPLYRDRNFMKLVRALRS